MASRRRLSLSLPSMPLGICKSAFFLSVGRVGFRVSPLLSVFSLQKGKSADLCDADAHKKKAPPFATAFFFGTRRSAHVSTASNARKNMFSATGSSFARGTAQVSSSSGAHSDSLSLFFGVLSLEFSLSRSRVKSDDVVEEEERGG